MGEPLKRNVMRLYDSMIVAKPKFISSICAFFGSILLVAAVYLFINQIVFLTNATSSPAPIVAVSHEYVGKGRGSVLAYVPTVRVRRAGEQTLDVKVDTFNEELVYVIGQQMAVSCNLPRGCVEDTFFARWGNCLIALLISLVFFSPLLAWKSGLWQSNDKITGLHLQRDP